MTKCGHIFCFHCIIEFSYFHCENDKNRRCPVCFQPLSNELKYVYQTMKKKYDQRELMFSALYVSNESIFPSHSSDNRGHILQPPDFSDPISVHSRIVSITPSERLNWSLRDRETMSLFR